MTEQPTVFISGAGRGIGRSTALRFAAGGYFVGLYDKVEGTLDDTTEQLRARHGEDSCCALRFDQREIASVRAAVDHFASHTDGRMDVLINNAAIMEVGLFEDISLDIHMDTVATNLSGLINLTYTGFPLLRETPGARLVNVSSTAALRGIPELASYSATKHAVGALTEALELEWAGHDIRVCDLMPGLVETRLLRDTQQLTAEQYLGVFLGPDDVAETIWRATHARWWQTHWPVGWQGWLLCNLFPRLPQFAQRAFFKTVTKL